MSDQFSLSSLNVIWTFFSFQYTLALECSRNCAWSFPWVCFFWQDQGSWLQAVSSHARLDHLVAAGLIPRSRSCIASIKIEIQQPSSSKFFRIWRWFLSLRYEFMVFWVGKPAIKSDFRRKVTTRWQKSYVRSLCTSVISFSEWTKGQIRDKGRTDPRVVRVGDAYFLSSSFLSDLRVFIALQTFSNMLFLSSPLWILKFGLLLNENV